MVIPNGALETAVYINLSIIEDRSAVVSNHLNIVDVVFELQFNETNYIACADIPIMDDNIAEDLESFTVVLSSVDPRVDIGSISSAVVTVVNNDSKH